MKGINFRKYLVDFTPQEKISNKIVLKRSTDTQLSMKVMED